MRSETGVRWCVLTIGQLPRNPFWGENDGMPRRAPLCTSVLVRAGDAVVLVDPPLPPDEMPALLDRRAGIRRADVTHVFLTHFHCEHRVGIEAFPDALWQISDAEWVYWDRLLAADSPARNLLRRVQTVRAEGSENWPLLHTVHLPGHTPGLSGLLFDDRDGWRVVIASDAVMTRDFFDAAAGSCDADDRDQARATIERLHGLADIILPGHDNVFWNPHARLK